MTDRQIAALFATVMCTDRIPSLNILANFSMTLEANGFGSVSVS